MSNSHIFYLEEFHVIVCRTCKYGLTKGGVKKHFRRRHKELELYIRRELEDHAKVLDVWEVEKIKAPTEEVTALEGLEIHEGFICTSAGCGQVAGTSRSIEEHCRDDHGWIKSKGTCCICKY